jgi:hypothetical protein
MPEPGTQYEDVSFYRGTPTVTLKNQLLEPSSAMGHAVEELNVLWRGATNRHKVASLLLTRSRGLDRLYSLHYSRAPSKISRDLLARRATQQHKYWPILLAWAQQPILSQNPPDEVGKRHATRLANQPASLELFSTPLAVARWGDVPGRTSHITDPSPLARRHTKRMCKSCKQRNLGPALYRECILY